MGIERVAKSEKRQAGACEAAYVIEPALLAEKGMGTREIL